MISVVVFKNYKRSIQDMPNVKYLAVNFVVSVDFYQTV